MNYLVYSDTERASYEVCFLVPAIRKDEIRKAYIDSCGLAADDVLVLTLHYEQGKKKTSVTEMRRYLDEELVPTLKDMQCKYILVADGEYFKVLAGVAKVDANAGYVLDSPYGDFKIIYVPNYKAIFYDPVKVRAKIAQGMQALADHRSGVWCTPGTDIIRHAEYPTDDEAIEAALVKLLNMECDLTCDIEAFDLKHVTAGIGTITFCWNQHEGIAFPVDYEPIEGATEAPFGRNTFNGPRRAMLRAFFEQFQHKLIFHSISYDVYVLIYQLFMDNILDTEGLLNGIEIMMRDWDDTKLITYLATNSCAGNKLGLKDQSQEFAGNYAMEDIKDIRKIPMDKLLEYNLVDGLATWYTHKKHWDRMVADKQLNIYKTLFKPATVDIIQMQLTGMPVNMKRVVVVKGLLTIARDRAIVQMEQTACVQRYNYKLKEQYIDKKHAEWKKKRITMAEVPADVVLNPNSPLQLQGLLFEMLALPVLSRTDSNQPSTDGDTIKALRNHTKDPDVIQFLDALVDFKAVDKILTSFIPAMEASVLGPDGWHYLFGNFNLGGTLSGRLSSSDPNLQNLPANGAMVVTAELMAMLELFDPTIKDYISKGKLMLGKLIKSCFQAPPGWLFCGLDFASLEDRISALTTKDPNKLKVYTDGYDGHCMRAFAYFGDQMPDIQDTVASINTIEFKYKALRQDSKAPTFALTYQGTYITLMANCGFTMEKAKDVEKKYHELYKVSDMWVAGKLDEASKTGYITAAFGLRLRTPLLHQVIRGNSKTPYEAQAEGRTAGNALGQSWCLLNSRASAEFMGGVRKSKHRLAIRPCAHIHDAQYMLVKDDISTIMYANKYLVKAVEWQAHPDIAHPDVKLGGEFSIFYPTWASEIGIPNHATKEQVFAAIDQAMS